MPSERGSFTIMNEISFSKCYAVAELVQEQTGRDHAVVSLPKEVPYVLRSNILEATQQSHVVGRNCQFEHAVDDGPSNRPEHSYAL